MKNLVSSGVSILHDHHERNIDINVSKTAKPLVELGERTFRTKTRNTCKYHLIWVVKVMIHIETFMDNT
jgi:hypothetical protein